MKRQDPGRNTSAGSHQWPLPQVRLSIRLWQLIRANSGKRGAASTRSPSQESDTGRSNQEPSNPPARPAPIRLFRSLGCRSDCPFCRRPGSDFGHSRWRRRPVISDSDTMRMAVINVIKIVLLHTALTSHKY